MAKAKRRKGTGLTPKEDAFCREYVINGGNGAAAYFKAYPASQKHTPKYRTAQASKLLRTTHIKQGIAEYTELLAEASAAGKPQTDAEMERATFRVDSDNILRELHAIAYHDPRRLFRWGTQDIPVINKKTGEVRLDEEGNPITVSVPFMSFANSDDLTEDDVRAIAGVEMTISKTGDPVLTVKRADKLKALNMLGQYRKLFTQNLNHSGEVKSGPINLVVGQSEGDV